ncbi:MAG: carbohydrate kinase family protein [Vicinamibacterales bacterium]
MMLLCAGEAFEDLIFVGLERLPDLGEEVKTDRFTATIGGGAVITAVQAARLGMKTTLISALGEHAVMRLKRERVIVTNLRKPNEPHAITAALSTADDRAFVTYNGVNAKLEERLAKILPKAKATHLHLCFYPHNCRHWTAIVSKLRDNGITTSWDFGWNEPLTNDRGLTELIDTLDFLFVNDREARLYTGTSSLQDAIAEWRKRKAITVVKLGDQGAVWLTPDRDILIPAPKVKAIDTTGAGDSFNAGFLVAWMNGKTPEQCLAAGNKVGAASTRKAGGL